MENLALTNKLAEDYWVRKVKKLNTISRCSGKTAVTKKLKVKKSDIQFFLKMTANSYLSELTIFKTVYSILIKRYFGNFDELIVSKFLDDHTANETHCLLFLPIISLDHTLKQNIFQVKEEVEEVESFKNFDFKNVKKRLNNNCLENYTHFSFSYSTNPQATFIGNCFHLNILKENDNGDVVFWIEYNDKFTENYIAIHFLSNIENLIINLEKYLSIAIKDIPLLDKNERQSLLEVFNKKRSNYPKDRSIVYFFEKKVLEIPHAIAVTFEGKEYSYLELNNQVNKLANYLIDHFNIVKGDIIGILLPKSNNSLISILAILKSGACYLPIDPYYPEGRIAYIIKDSLLKLLIVDENSDKKEIVCDKLDISKISWSALKETNPNRQILPNDLAYVIYTSGSTGRPKGVMVEHASNVNMILEQINAFNVTSEDKVIWFASIAFDASVSEILMALYAGATLIIPNEETIKDTERFVSFLKTSKATIVTLPPSYLDLLENEDLCSLKSLITAGEIAHVKKATELSNVINYFNAYGPTECSVCVSIYKVKPED